MRIPIQSGQELVAVPEGDGSTLRIHKDGHNRGIAKMEAWSTAALLAHLLNHSSIGDAYLAAGWSVKVDDSPCGCTQWQFCRPGDTTVLKDYLCPEHTEAVRHGVQ